MDLTLSQISNTYKRNFHVGFLCDSSFWIRRSTRDLFILKPWRLPSQKVFIVFQIENLLIIQTLIKKRFSKIHNTNFNDRWNFRVFIGRKKKSFTVDRNTFGFARIEILPFFGALLALRFYLLIFSEHFSTIKYRRYEILVEKTGIACKKKKKKPKHGHFYRVPMHTEKKNKII